MVQLRAGLECRRDHCLRRHEAEKVIAITAPTHSFRLPKLPYGVMVAQQTLNLLV